jgi:hypothetical protein
LIFILPGSRRRTYNPRCEEEVNAMKIVIREVENLTPTAIHADPELLDFRA